MVHVVWFKRDLRITDHRALAEAALRGPVLPLYVVEPGLWAQPDASGRQWEAVRDGLADLRADLAALGQPLVVRVGEVVPLLARIHDRLGIDGLHSHEETGNAWTYARDRAVGAWCRAVGVPWTEHRQTGVIRRLRDRDGWAARWEAFMAEPITPPPAGLTPLGDIPIGAIPSASDLGLAPDPCPFRQRGGRRAGLDEMASFFQARGRDYRGAMSSPGPGAEACSRLSLHLATGTLSMREVSQEAGRRHATARDPAWRASIASFASRLRWHCHFMQKLEDEPALEERALHPAYRDLDRTLDPARQSAWCEGRTGWPFVDACVRSLAATGWLNFRMRAMLMAVASYHLWLPWRATGLQLARWFTDYEPGIHWPQVQMQSGVTGINTIRIYNPVKQGLDQDPTGAFVRRWVPELADVPDAFIHEPWRWPEVERLRGRYPSPVVDHVEAARLARERMWGIRGAAGFGRDADRVQAKHGSRRSGLPPTSRRKPAGNSGQLSLGLDGPGE